jgi:hypothetical protein
MAQTYRKAKIEEFYKQVADFRSLCIQSADSQTDESFKRYLKGQSDAFEYILQKLQRDFDLTAE